MSRVVLGGSGRSVASVGLGCMGMSWAYDSPGRDEAASVRVIHEAIDLGVDLFDTSDQYGPFTNEMLVGEALVGRRDEVVLATKGGLVVGADGVTRRDGRPDHLRSALDASLGRLRTEQVDLYQLHRVDPTVPLEESWGALADLAREGKVARLGLSEVTVEEIRRAQAIHPVATVQSELSLWTRDALAEVLPYCAQQGIAFVAYSPLGRGFLSGRYGAPDDLPADDWRRRSPRFSPESFAANEALLGPLRAIASDLDVTPAQVALAWVLRQGPNVVAIPGTKTSAYLRQNVAAADIELVDDALRALDELPEPVGARY